MGKNQLPKVHRAGLPIRIALLGGVSALPMAAVFFSPHAAYAESCPPNVSSSVTGPVETVNGSDCTITSAGTISGYAFGVSNPNANGIGALLNQGTVIGNLTGIFTKGSIGTLANSGSISGVERDGIDNEASGIADHPAVIGTLSNTGNISSGGYGIINSTGAEGNFHGTIGLLINSGTITGTEGGVYNSTGGNVGLFTNQSPGTISSLINGIGGTIGAGGLGAGSTAVNNAGAIGALSNYGTIAGAAVGVNNSGSIGVLTDFAEQGIGGATAIFNTGTIGQLTNYGSIAGGNDGISNVRGGTIAAISDIAGGTISGGAIGVLNSNSGVIGSLAIGTLSNNGSISADSVIGGVTGVDNAGGTIFQLSNGGTIQGGRFGIVNSPAVASLETDVILSSTTTHIIQSSISTLTNTGSITGGGTGIYNDGGFIGTLTNAGSISGTNYTGIYNSGTIGTINNTIGAATGIIAGGTNGIYNNAIVGTLSNAGTITATDAAHGGPGGVAVTGVQNFNSGVITLLSNAANATISGGSSGIYNLGSITTLSNAGTISGGSTGIDNEGAITTLANSGHISGGSSGIDNEGGSIGQLTNSGTITGTTGAGIFNSYNRGPGNLIGAISTLANQTGGLITGVTGIYNATTIGTLTNSGSITGGTYGVLNAGSIGGVANLSGGYISDLDNTSIIGGGATALGNAGSIATLTNNGAISGATYGINNTIAGVIGTLTNSGTIAATATSTNAGGFALAGLSNQGSITEVNNQQGGTIAGYYYGFDNEYDGTLGTLINSGLISGADNFAFGLTADNTIGVIDNTATGTITGGEGGVSVDGTIGTIINAGTIAGNFGIYESNSTIGTLANSGLITASDFPGIALEGGTINLFTNNGTIISAASAAVSNSGVIGTLTNSGIVTGYDGVINDQTIGTLLNETTGTLAGSISGSIGVFNSYDFESPATIGLLRNGLAGASITADTIFGSITGVSNQSNIGTLANNGTIAGGSYGVANSFANTDDCDGAFESSCDGVRTAATNGRTIQATIVTLTNTGSITGGDTGVYNDGGLIGTLTNTGSITGNVDDGIVNTGAIYTIANLGGTIIGGIRGIGNAGDGTFTGVIGLLSNTGAILGGSGGIGFGGGGIYNGGGYIGTINNSGLISGVSGVFNEFGRIITLSNTGTIIGQNGSAVSTTSNSTIATITNTGLASGNVDGILNDGTIINLTNAAGGTINGGAYGIQNAGTISLLANSGRIAGTRGITNNGNIGTLSQSGGGTITGSQFGILNLNGGTITQLTNGVLGDVQSNVRSAALTNDVGNDGNIAGGTLAVARDTIHGGTTGVANADGYIGTLTNNGTISGGDYGIGNYGGTSNQSANATIATLTNNGLVTSIDDAISNYAEIGALTNAGTIHGNNGIYNNGTITLLTNNNLITGTEYGLYNYNDIGQATNNDVILGITAGVYNYGTVAGLTNNGTILSAIVGVDNFSSIGTLTNTALITGGRTGIDNAESATIGTLTNNGTIATDNGILPGNTSNGVTNEGLISQFTNTGVISGEQSGIYSPGTIGLLVNTGTIDGSIATGLYLATGEAINESGGVIEGGSEGIAIGTQSKQTGGSSTQGRIQSGGQLTNSGVITSRALTNVIDLNPSGTALVFNQPGGLIEGAEGAFFFGAGSTLINAGTIISTIGGNAIDFGSSGGNFLTITTGSEIIGTIYGGGTENQIALDGTGTLNNTIADFAPGSALNVAPGADWTAYGNWQINTVTNDGVFQPGIIGTPLNLTGNFVQNPDGTLRVLVSPSDSPFVTTHFNVSGTAQLAGGVEYYFAPGTYSTGTIAFLTAAGGVTGGFSSVTYNLPPAAYSHETLIFTADGDLRLAGIVAPLDDSIFSDEIQSSAATAQNSNTALLNKASEGEAASAEAATCAAEAAVTPADVTPGQTSGVEKLTNAVASAICGAGGWIQATGTAMRAYGDSDVPSYDADTAGFLAGIERPVNTYGLRLGLAVGYDETFLLNGAGSKGQVDTTRFGIFGSQPLGQFTLAGDFMAGFSNTTTNRVTGVGLANSTHAGDVFSGALQIETLEAQKYFDLIPQAGIRIAAVNAGGFDETGNNVVEPFSLTGAHSGYDSVQPFVNLSLTHRFLIDSGISITPDASLGYFYEAGSRGRAVTLDARDGTVFTSHYVSLAGSAGQGEFSLSASKGMWSWYASYSADVAGNWVSQTGEAGLHLRF